MKKVILALGMTLTMASVALAANTNGTIDAAGAYQGSTQYGSPLEQGKYTDTQTKAASDELAVPGFSSPTTNANATGVGADGSDKDQSVIKSQGMVNANGTSTKDTSGNVISNQRTHGEYQSNTNSCASCHQTHTAASKQLLFKDGVYATCTACHDGTLGFYNVFAKGAMASTAGTFGGGQTDAGNSGNPSVHLATGVMQLKAAPGGNFNGSGTDIMEGEGTWGSEFTCASCHSPHGSYSDRLLHYNPNNVGGTDEAEGGYYLPGEALVDATTALPVATETSPLYVTVKTTPALAGITGEAAERVVVLLKKNTDTTTNPATYSYKKDDRPWLYLAEYDAGHVMKKHLTAAYDLDKPFPDQTAGKNPWGLASYQQYGNNIKVTEDQGDNTTAVKDAAGTIISVTGAPDGKPDVAVNTGVFFHYNKGYAAGTAAKIDALDKIDIAPATVVKLQGGKPNKPMIQVDADADTAGIQDFGGIKIMKVDWNVYDDSGVGEKITAYCAACHTDYKAESGEATGVWSKAFRHTTTSASYTCLKCHFAHGTDVSVMKDAKDNTVDALVAAGTMTQQTAEEYMVDKNKSSALKRYTNMAVCWKCHTSSHNNQLLNNDSYWNNFNYGSAPSVTADPTQSPAGYTTK